MVKGISKSIIENDTIYKLKENEVTHEIKNQSEYPNSSEKVPEERVDLTARLGEIKMNSNKEKMQQGNILIETMSALVSNPAQETNNKKNLIETIPKDLNKREEEFKAKFDMHYYRNKGMDQFDKNKIKDSDNQQEISHHNLQTLKPLNSIQQLKPVDQENRSQAVNRVKIFYKSKEDQEKYFPNILFYAGEIKSNFDQSKFITQLLERRGNYNKLEMDHSYIQWIFPNKYQSMFNNESKPLKDPEIDIFIRNVDLSLTYIECYEMMLDFYGMRLLNKRTGKLGRSLKPYPNDYKTRYYEAVCGHNCLRIRRILTSLNNLGFRKYAMELVNFLKQEITEGEKPLEQRKWDFDYDWKQYGECTTKEEIKELEKQTFQKIEQLERINILLILEDEKYMKTHEKKEEMDDFGIV